MIRKGQVATIPANDMPAQSAFFLLRRSSGESVELTNLPHPLDVWILLGRSK